ncbi:MAG: alpha-ketoglutarate-dependent dioxygenase AlkB [Chlamydiales bacterium]
MSIHACSRILLQPGLLLLKQAVNSEEQSSLVKLLSEQTFYPSGNNTDRMRFYDRVECFPLLLETYLKIMAVVKKMDEHFIEAVPTHVITLRYNSFAQTAPHIPWHTDNGKNDGLEDYPVTSISLGDSCDFLVCNEKPRTAEGFPASNPSNLKHRVILDAGDALVFYGPSRMIWHAIYDMTPKEGYRYNVTYRRTPHLIGKENEYAVVPPGLGKNNPFYSI